MPTTKPKFRRPLNTHQIKLLQTIYKFRFATAALIAQSQGSKYVQVINIRLKTLVEQSYIGQNYDSSYKIQGKPATYYLQLEAVRYLRQQSYASPKVLKSIYYDKNAKDDQIAHYLHVFAVYNALKQHFPEAFLFYSQSELREKKSFPRPRPDAWIKRAKPSKSQPNNYFLLNIEENRYWALRRRVRTIIEYADADQWERVSDDPFPVVLMVCEHPILAMQMKKIAERELETTPSEITFISATLESLPEALS